MSQTTSLDAEYEHFARAMFLEAMPVNPRPFQAALTSYMDKGGDPTSETGRAISWMAMAAEHHKQWSIIPLPDEHPSWPGRTEVDLLDEYVQLDGYFNSENNEH